MKKEDITVLAQLLTAMKDSAEKLDRAKKENNLELIKSAKRELLNFQKKIGGLL